MSLLISSILSLIMSFERVIWDNFTSASFSSMIFAIFNTAGFTNGVWFALLCDQAAPQEPAPAEATELPADEAPAEAAPAESAPTEGTEAPSAESAPEATPSKALPAEGEPAIPAGEAGPPAEGRWRACFQLLHRYSFGTVVRYNVKDPDLSEVFSLSVSSRVDYSAEICPSYIVNICATYTPVNKESNMGIIEVNLVSGYRPDIQGLERIVNDVTGTIKRYDVDGSQVIFYIDQFTDSQICVDFPAFQEVEVEFTHPGTVKVYDYYEPDFYVTKVSLISCFEV
ncbi:Alpha-macroglobulin receptor-binding [Trinorchestia longiramus]|nr:Alpha-macroglobulin receptor-binding [Trinorchestia longiramus]